VTRRAGAVALALAALALAPAPAGARTVRRVLIVVVGAGPPDALLARLSASGFGELGLMTTSVGSFNEQQFLLDVTQGARVPRVDYSPQAPPALHVSKDGAVSDWRAVLRRAQSADASLVPGLLAGSIPGGGGYATSGDAAGIDALLAAGRDGRVAQVSLGSKASLAGRVAALLRERALVVVRLKHANALLHRLVRGRPRSELVIALEQPPATAPAQTQAPKLLAVAAAGLGATRGALTTGTTRTDGLVSASDLGPTVMAWLGLRGPSQFTGQPITLGVQRSLRWFGSFARRLVVIEGRRMTALLAFLVAWVLVLTVAIAARRDPRAGLRLGGLAALWAPAFALLGAALEPSGAVEIALIVGGAFAAALASDRLVRWPRSASVPVAVLLVLCTVALVGNGALIETSLIGSDPISGARFFGAGNELAALLPVALFAGLAAALPQRPAERRDTAIFIAGGAALTLIVAWGRLGANVGSIFTIGGGTAIAAALLAPGGPQRRHVGWATLAVVTALGLLALLDLATGGGAHFTRQVLHAHSLTSLYDTLRRRLSEAGSALLVGAVLPAAAVCLAGALVVFRERKRVLAPLGRANAWGAALAGGFGGAVLGSIANDSGPRVLLVGCGMLACVTAYICGAPSPDRHPFLSDA
jgi:hypothetical protein